MNISYNWLKEYVNFDLTPDETAAALTSIGLETGGVEEVQTIKGGLEGLVIGEVLTCVEHPNSDHLHITTVNLGEGDPVQIVCGAPNVAAGQKVVVATLGTKLYDGDECFMLKMKSVSVRIMQVSSFCRKMLFRVLLPKIIIISRAIMCLKWISRLTVRMPALTTG